VVDRRAQPIDWPEVHARLARTREAIDALLEPDEDRGRQLMDERARLLARPAEIESTTDSLELAFFTASGEELAIETSYVLRVARLPPVEPIPSVPPVFLGVTNYQSIVLPVVSLAALLGGAQQQESHEHMLVLGHAQPEIVVAIASTESVVRVPVDEISAPEAWQRAPNAAADDAEASLSLVRGILAGRRIVLRGDALLHDPRLFLVGDSHANDDR
jgi:chemotaxis signal transduction protein